MMRKQNVKPFVSAVDTEQDIKFQQEYKKALKHQNKTFNQNGK